MRFIRWMFAGSFKAEYNAGYRAAVDRILLLPEKVRLGNTLELTSPGIVRECSFVGGSPAIRIVPPADGVQITNNYMEWTS